MEVKEENVMNKLLCHACLVVGRCVFNITNENLMRYYLDALDEIPLSNTKQLVNITVCWECKAILQKCWSFREQAKDSYRILLAYTKENLNDCLLTDVSRTPHLQTHTLTSINIIPSENEHYHEIPIVHVKDEVDKTFNLEEDSLPDTLGTDSVSDTLDNSEEILKTQLETIICTVDRKDKKSRRDTKQKAKRTKKSDRTLREKRAQNCNTISTLKNEEPQELSIIHVKNEFSDNCGEDERLINNLRCTTDSNKSKDDSLPDNDRLPDTFDNCEENLKSEIESIVRSIERKDKKLRRDLKHKDKRTKKIGKRLEAKKVNNKKIDQKVITIELSYEDMLAEREKELKKEAYLKAEYKCETCIVGFHYKKTYQAHLTSKHSAELGEYICPICKVIVASVDSFSSHYKRHMRRYECVICHKRTSDLKVMEQHYYSTHEISLKKYTCNVCGKVSNSVDTHRYHKDTHKARVQCPECDKTFRHRAGLMNHRLTVHEFHNAFPCTVCDKVFRWKTSLKRHLLKHEAKSTLTFQNKPSTPASPFCAMCNISFSSVCSYQRHLRNSLKHVTQDQLRFICDHCKRRFSDKTKLRDHIEEKHLNRTYQCDICSKPSKNRVGLDQHIRNVHKGRPKNKMCHYCGRGFPTKMQLESHMRTHTGERPFICEFCPTTFSQQSNLYKHYRQVHLNIKTKRYPMSKKRKEDSESASKVPAVASQAEIEDPYRPMVLQYSPERGFVL